MFLILATNNLFAQAKKVIDKSAVYKNPPASRITLGFTLGLGSSWISNLPKYSGAKLSYDLGLSMMYSRNEHWSLGAQLLASREGYRISDTTDDVAGAISVNPLYLRLPLQVTYFLGKRGNRIRPKIYLGPSFAIKMSERYRKNDQSVSAIIGLFSHEQFNTIDAGINSGVGLNVYEGGRTWLAIDLGYYYGFANALNASTSSADHFNRNLRLNVGLMWGL